ncbi:putative RNA helicase [Neophaeococcomyces mojaviensis]|uniref:RNA helicase n=1 Tax=Neophaeococcomyces mojaviensis TaxID=3383035 RepID=A0ACC2ZR69_9EURO|nr:putative RNA helicase [Knufia sp. JES_112]
MSSPRTTVPVKQYVDSSENESQSDADFPQPSSKRRRISNDVDEQAQFQAYTVPSRVKNTARTSGTLDGNDHDAIKTNGLTVKTTNTDFSSVNVAPWLVHSLRTMEIHNPTEIQRSCIPEILKGRDCIGGSRTGTGKTVAFAVPILQKWSEDPYGIYAVILTPTRELALQIYEQFTALGAPQALKTVLVTGGTDMRPQAQALAKRPHVVIATPGRLADHIETSGEETVRGLRRVKVVVFDEADRLLSASAGMLPDISTCLATLPPSNERLTLLFTATVTPEVRALKDQPCPKDRLPVFISEVKDQLDPESTTGDATMIPSRLKQTYLQVPPTHKDAFLYMLLLHLLTTDPDTLSKSSATQNQIIIFTNRTQTADLLHRTLHKLFAETYQSKDPSHASIAHLKPTVVTSLSSALPQSQRTSNLAAFRASTARILISTDLSSRGLDIPTCTHVINYDVSRDPVDYVHRVGRTARAGRKGTSITFVGPRDVELILAIEEYVGGKMAEWKAEGDEEVNIETRVVRGRTLKDVGEARMEALRETESGKDVKGYRGRIRKKR